MGILVPTYTKLSPPVNGGPIEPTLYTNVYISLRFETPIVIHNPDGQTYTINGRAKVYQNSNSIYQLDSLNFNFTLTKDQLNAPLHTLIYNYIKSLYPGSTDSEA